MLTFRSDELHATLEEAQLSCGRGRQSSVRVRGWCVPDEGSVVLLQAAITGHEVVLLESRERRDVLEAFPAKNYDVRCGFEADLPFTDRGEGSIALQLYVTLSSGATRVLLFNPKLIVKEAQPQSRSLSTGERVAVWRENRFAPGPTLDWVDYHSLHSTGSQVHLRTSQNPTFSIIILHRQAEAPPLRALRSLENPEGCEFEVLIAVPPRTSESIKSILTGTRIFECEPGMSEVATINMLSSLALGTIVIVLDSDVSLRPNTLAAASEAIERRAVPINMAPIIIRSDGSLESSGCSVWADGAFSNYGAGDTPLSPQYKFRRQTDACSSLLAFLHRDTLLKLGGLDTSYLTVEVALVDYCLRANGLSSTHTWYEPAVVGILNAPQRGNQHRTSNLESDRRLLYERHRSYMDGRPKPGSCDEVAVRWPSHPGKRILFLTDRVDDAAGGGRKHQLIRMLCNEGHRVTVFECEPCGSNFSRADSPLSLDIELYRHCSSGDLQTFIEQRRESFDVFWVTQPGGLRLLQVLLGMEKKPIIFDPDIEVLRTSALAAWGSHSVETLSRREEAANFPDEQWIVLKGRPGCVYRPSFFISFASYADLVVVSSEAEQLALADFGIKRLVVRDSDPGRFVNLALSSAIGAVERGQAVTNLNIASQLLSLPELWQTDPVIPPFGYALRDSKPLGLRVEPQVLVSEAWTPDVVIPVFNAAELVKNCFTALFLNTDRPFNLFVIDDASTDPRIKEIFSSLASLASRYVRKIVLIRNERNLGFTGSVNAAFSYTTGHIVLLNTDTEVPPGWLSRLLAPLSETSVASTTPLSNSATICSYPTPQMNNPLPSNISAVELDEYFRKFAPPVSIDTPTGVGFCMAMSRNAINAIGFLDADLFRFMYGEENDWCRRAIQAGFRNVITPNLFVLHHDSGSIGGGSSAQLQSRSKNLEWLTTIDASYDPSVQRFIRDDPLCSTRNLIRMITSLEGDPRPATLCIHNAGLMGGSARFFQAQLETLMHDRRVLILGTKDGRCCLTDPTLDPDCSVPLDISAQTCEQFQELLQFLRIEDIYLNHLAGLPVSKLTELISQSGRPYTWVIHDYFAACPMLTMLNHAGRYCGAETKASVCDECIRKTRFLPFGPVGIPITKWRDIFGRFLTNADRVVAPSKEAASIINRYYPNVPIEIPSEWMPLDARYTYDHKFASDTVLTIATIGALGQHKGSDIVYELADRLRAIHIPIRLKVIGYTDRHREPYRSPDGNFEVLGQYAPENISELLAAHRVSLCLNTSICPETYSFAVQEALLSGYPVVTFDLGAPAGRVRNLNGGWIVEDQSAAALLEVILQLYRARSSIGNMAESLKSSLVNGTRPSGAAKTADVPCLAL